MKLKRFLEIGVPSMKGAVKISAADQVQKYRDRYDIMKARGLRFKIKLHYTMPDRRKIVHIMVPSETVHNFYYDVLLELNDSGGAKSFEDCHIRVFSNCPSFVYTYAYVFYHLEDDELGNKHSMMIDDFKQKIPEKSLMVQEASSKLGELPLTKRPVMRNPYGLPMFDKSIFYAIWYLMETFDFNRVMYNKHISTIDSIMREITDFDTLMLQRKSLERKERDKEKKTKEDTEQAFKQNEEDLNRAGGVRKIRSKVKGALKPVPKHKPISSLNKRKKK